MSTTSLRIVAAGGTFVLAIVIAILTGIAGGFSASGSCAPTDQATPPAATEQAPPSGVQPSPDQDQPNQDQPNQDLPNQDRPNQDQPGGGGGGGVNPDLPGNQPNNGGGINPNGNNGDFTAVITADKPGTKVDTPPAEQVQPTEQDCGVGFSFSIPAAVVGFFGTLLAGFLVLGLMILGQRRDRPVAAVAPTSAVPNEGNPDRDKLVQTLVYVRDRANSQALGDRIMRDLVAIGVIELRPDGEPFDSARHEAGGSQETEDPRLDGRIAAVETPGYVDQGRILRLPVVTVYRRSTS